MPEILLANWSIESTTIEMDFLEASASSTRAGSRRASDTSDLRYLKSTSIGWGVTWPDVASPVHVEDESVPTNCWRLSPGHSDPSVGTRRSRDVARCYHVRSRRRWRRRSGNARAVAPGMVASLIGVADAFSD
jgi:hypothetical protein